MTKDKFIELANHISEGKAGKKDIEQYLKLTKKIEKQAEPDIYKWQKQKPFVFANMENRLFNIRPLGSGVWRKLAVAASILICLGIGSILLINKKAQHASQEYLADFTPATNKAILVLANGKKILIDNQKSGVIAKAGGIIIKKDISGQIVYEADKDYKGLPDTNTVITPRGAAHQIVLADGTHVWLNAASSLKFPTAFNQHLREVKLTGEAYFEVTKDNSRLFRVQTISQTVEVHGTHFNVNAYEDEGVENTTLLEGSVLISNKGHNVWLKPGEQCQNSKTGSGLKVTECENLESVVAWKNGQFSFNNANVKEVMNQISRWYDVDIEYKSENNKYRLSADFSRNMNSSKVLKILNYTGLKFKAEGRKIIVE